MNIHPAAKLFPLLAPEEMKGLAEDIGTNGLLNALVVTDGCLLDGRNRLEACKLAGVEPRFVEWDRRGSPTAYVISANLHRRHLTKSQAACIAVDALPIYEAEAKARQLATLKKGDKPVSPKLGERGAGKAAEHAASAFGVSHGYVEQAKTLKEKKPEKFERVKSGEMTLQEALSTAHVSHNAGDHEWYTPEGIIGAALEVLGAIDLDPASSAEANEVVKAARFFDAETDGLKQPWSGRVWMNPPYAQPLIAQFCEKLVKSLSSGKVMAAIVLVNNATETAWFQEMALRCDSICFPCGRVKFWSPDRISAPLQGQALVYFGAKRAAFRIAFERFGAVFER